MERVTLTEHPSRNSEGGPLFPDLRAIRLDGKVVGYTGDPPYHRVSFIDHWAGMDPWVVNAVKILVETEFKVKPDRISNVPEPIDGEYLDGDED